MLQGGVMITLEGFGAGVGILAIFAATVRYIVRAELNSFKVVFSEEIKVWVNGSFMRSAVVGEQLKSMAERIQDIEENGCSRGNSH